MLRYAITDRTRFAGDEGARTDSLVRQCARWSAEGVDFIQLREKDLEAGAMADLTRLIVRARRETGSPKLLVNARADVAMSTGCDGVHLTASPEELTAEQVRRLYASAGMGQPTISVSCHSIDEVKRAVDGAVDVILFGPVFEKVADGRRVVAGCGLEVLHAACVAAGAVPVLALGGVTDENAQACLDAGAQGIAGIRLFGEI
jgi:thiamine-phosphate pyrophosphorylase